MPWFPAHLPGSVSAVDRQDPHIAESLRAAEGIVGPLSKAGPLGAVALTTLAVWAFGLDGTAGVAILGEIPAGRRPPGVPTFHRTLVRKLLPAAVLVLLVGFLEAASVAKSLTTNRRQKIDATQKVRASGAVNIGSALTSGFTVAGGFGRSMMNFTARLEHHRWAHRTFGRAVHAAVLLSPQATLTAIIMLAVSSLIDFKFFRESRACNKADAVLLAATFFAVLALRVELMIVLRAVLSIALYLSRTGCATAASRCTSRRPRGR